MPSLKTHTCPSLPKNKLQGTSREAGLVGRKTRLQRAGLKPQSRSRLALRRTLGLTGHRPLPGAGARAGLGPVGLLPTDLGCWAPVFRGLGMWGS